MGEVMMTDMAAEWVVDMTDMVVEEAVAVVTTANEEMAGITKEGVAGTGADMEIDTREVVAEDAGRTATATTKVVDLTATRKMAVVGEVARGLVKGHQRS